LRIYNKREDKRNAKKKRTRLVFIPVYVILILVAAIYLFPFVYSFIGSLMTYETLMRYPPSFIPETIENYIALFKLEFANTKLFPRWIANSIFLAVATTALNLFFASLAGFSFAKLKFRGKNLIFAMFLSTLMLPSFTLLPTRYMILQNFGWINTYLAIIIPGMCTVFNVFLMRQFYSTIPQELIDAAKIDGCTYFGIYSKIAFPLSKPALAALSIYTFMGSWNGFEQPLFFLQTIDKYTLPLGMSFFKTQNFAQYNLILAASVISIIPTLVIFIIFQKRFTRGIALTGMKE